MTQPITLYPDKKPGYYHTEHGQLATPIITLAGAWFWCVHCLQPLEAPSREHWHIDGHSYCKNCVVVAAEEKGP